MKLSKPFRFLKAAAFSIALIAFNSCADMTTSVSAPTITITASKNLTSPENFKVSQGGKRKITLDWNTVEIAKSYKIFAATSPNDTFEQIGETTKNTFEDTVGAGRTYYYKVCAVNFSGESSEFTSIKEGTSLATPIISSIEAEDSYSTVYWYMENSAAYSSQLVYELYCSSGSEVHQATVNGSVSSYTFEGLNSNTDYVYHIEAYLTSDQSATESSAKVTKETVAQYNPVPPEFTASQGESVESINLLITLPIMVQVSTTKTNSTAEEIVDYPLCFEIQRKESNQNDSEYKTIIRNLYYNGEAKAPSSYNYKAGEVIEYKDLISETPSAANAGKVYEYRIYSCIDTNYSSKAGYTYNSKVKSRNAKTSTGFALYKPSFSKKTNDTINPNDHTKLLNTKVTFSANWEYTYGKESFYRFAILQTYTTPSSGSGNNGSTFTSWIENSPGKALFDTIGDINNFTVCYDLSTNPQTIIGTYQYTLYVMPETCDDPTNAVETNNYLTFVRINGKTTITDDAEKLKTDIAAEGGWANKINLSWAPQSGAHYKLSRIKSNDENPTPTIIDEATILSGLGKTEFPTNETVVYSDTSVESGHVYSYTLIASKGDGQTEYSSNDPAVAKTLGTAELSIPEYSYTDIKVSMPIVVAANTYTITLGEQSSLGNGNSLKLNVNRSEDGKITSIVYDENNSVFTLDANNEPSGQENSARVTTTLTPNKIDTGSINIVIQKPIGYNKASISGTPVKLKVTAASDKAETTNADFLVSTVGPAATNIKGTDSIGFNSNAPGDISITWNACAGANGYAVYRTREAIPGTQEENGTINNYKNESTCVYFIGSDCSKSIKDGGGTGSNIGSSVDVQKTNETFTLTDHYKDNSGGNSSWDVDQELLGLGIKYTYSVFPVLADTDSANRKAAYTDVNEANTVQKICAAGYTKGYGIDLEASKAEYSDSIVLAWNMPTNNTGNRQRNPTIWYRQHANNNTNTWHKVELTNYDKNYYVLKSLAVGVSDLEPLEFAVTYNPTFNPSDNNMDKVYTTYLGSICNKGVTEDESKNIGYMFTLPEFTFNTTENNDYSEDATWYSYNEKNTTHRKILADGDYTLTLTNYNKKTPTIELATYDNAGTKKSHSALTGANASMNFSNSDKTIKITPSISNDEHNGILKVLRDTKHYYNISTTRQSKASNYKFSQINAITQPTSTVSTTRTGYTFRKITPTEFTKCVTLIMADSLNQEGSQAGTLSGASGTFNVTFAGADISTGWLGNHYHYQYTNYKANFAKAPGKNDKLKSSFILNSNKSDAGYCIDNMTKKWGNNTINVTHESGFASYAGSLTHSAGSNFGSWNLSISATCGSGSKTISIDDDKDNFKKWFPFALTTKLKTTQSDGTKFADDGDCWTYQSPWWE
ncbi:MAG: hypothetical protein K5917_02605 [Clostridiales bacterium]|nr:hypothetical protein [Clostridiales bacterium]